MDLINTTVAPAELFVTDIANDRDDGSRLRRGYVLAKASFHVAASGRVSIHADPPEPILRHPMPTELGIVPSDVLLRQAPGVDVMVLGAAYSSGRDPVERRSVKLRIRGSIYEVIVTGDRTWIETGEGAVIGSTQPFHRMPMTWNRAFGGRAEVWLDAGSPVRITYPWNADGVGFDAAGEAARIGTALKCPRGFPRLDYVRALPNLEDPAQLVATWNDEPEPRCWAPLPLEHGLRMRMARTSGESVSVSTPPAVEASGDPSPISYAHPTLRQLPLGPGDQIGILGMTPGNREWELAFPDLRVQMEYEVATRRGTLRLAPVQLVLFPEESRFTITYNAFFKLRLYNNSQVREARLRVEG